MSNQIHVQVEQVGPSTSQGTAREHTAVMDRPTAKGGENRGAMGGEHLLMALGGCFMSNLLAAARSRDAEVSNVILAISGTVDSAPSRFSAVHMDITAEGTDQAVMEKLVAIAEKGCIVANTLRGSVSLSIRLARTES